MKKFLTLFLALTATCFSSLNAAQLSFETEEELSHWHFINENQSNYWTIGTAAGSTDGQNALYITTDGVSYGYNNSATSVVWAYCDIPIAAGRLSFDWQGLGENNYDYVSAYLIPIGSLPTAGSTTLPEGSVELTGQLCGASSWQSTEVEFANTTTVYNLFFMWRNDGSAGNTPIAIDNIQYDDAVVVGDFVLGLRGDSAYVVVSYIGSGTDVVIPNSYENLPIVSISENCFKNNVSLTSITIPEGVTSINSWTFYNCSSLASVTIPEGVTSIGAYAFYNCSSLTSVTIPEGVTSIGACAFYNCSSLTSVTIPEGVTSIGGSAFYNCTSLASVTIPESVTSINGGTFYNCSSLASVAIPEGVTSIGERAFYNCSFLTQVVMTGITPPSLGSNVFTSTSATLSILVPYEVIYKRYWSEYADKIYKNPLYCGQTEVTLSANTDKSALHQALGLDSLQKVTDLKINGTINSYDIMMLRNQMPKLWRLDLSDASIVANSYEYTKGYCSQDDVLTAQSFTGTGTRILSVILPKTLKALQSGAFNNYVMDVTIPEGLTELPASAFSNHTNLWQVSLSNTLVSIGNSAFSDCSQLKYITMPAVVQIGNNAFEKCTALDSISLPESLETIGDYAFQGTGLKSVTIPANVVSIGTRAFAGSGSYYSNSYYLYETSTSTSRYSYTGWGYIQELIIPAYSRLKTISASAFAGNYNLKKISILGDSITAIDVCAFAYCGMDTLVLPPNLTSLSTLSFGYCSNLKYIVMPNSLTEIYSNAFVGCTNLDNVQFPTKLTTIGHHAFADCTNLRNVDIPGLVTSIGEYAFKDCNVTSVYSYLFDPFTIGQNTFSPYANANATLYIPNVEDTEMKYLYDTQWSQFLNRVRLDKDFEYKDFYATGDVVIGDNDDPLKGDPNANLQPGSGLVVEEGENGQRLGVVTITGEPGDWASIIAGCNLHVDSLRIIINVEGNCWNFFGFPFEIPVADIRSNGKYVIYEYDGKTRAERDTTGWKRLPKEETHLHPGHGYIFNFNAAGSLVITLPAPNFCNLLEKILLYVYPSAKPNNKSWNYAANPFFAYYSLNDLNFTGPITFWDSRYKTYRSYRPGDDDYYLSPYEGFFLQNDLETVFELTFDKTKAKTKKQTEEEQAQAAYKPARKQAEEQRALVNLTLSNDEFSDDTRIVINPAAMLTYDLGMDAQKFFSTESVPQIYSLDADQLPCAINERPIDNGIVNLGLRLPASGAYRIGATRMDHPFFLLDRERNVLHNFADGDYVFTGSGTLTTRFALVEHYDAPTAAEQVQEDEIEQTPDGLYIHGTAEIRIYSMTGMELYNGTYSGAITLPTGVYTLVHNGTPRKFVVH